MVIPIAGFRRIAPFDIYLHDRYFVVTVVTASGLLLLGALICGILAVLYFAISRWRLHAPNNIVGLASFAITAVSLIFLLVTAFLRDDSPQHYSQLYARFIALFGFLLGFVLLAANLAWAFAWTLVTKVQSHFSPR
jgi:hypothetical protein